MSGYPNTLKYFMWPWQVHFKISAQVSAESLFNVLDKKLLPNVFLIGFLNKERPDRLPICIDPESDDYLIEKIINIQEIADQLYEKDNHRGLYYTGEGIQEDMDNRLKRGSFRKALEKILNELPENSNKICFATSAALIDDYRVFLVLELDRNVYYSHGHLKNIDPKERFVIYNSFLETVKDSYLKVIFTEMNLPEPGMSHDSKSSEEILREAAKNFTNSIAWKGKIVEGIFVFFNTCNKMSISRYEGSENRGHLIIAEENHPEIEMKLEIDIPFNINDDRKTRKLLQLSNESIGVITNSKKVFGLGTIKNTYQKSSESIFDVFFRGIHCWDIMHKEDILLQMRYGLPQLSSEIIVRDNFFLDGKRIFGNVSDTQLENLYLLAISVTKQKKGAMIVIMEDAPFEARRLSNQCINIKPIKLNTDLTLSLTAIDGSVLIDLDGVAYAKGAILDGIVGYNGDASRGSRFNSALTYEEHRGLEKPTMIIVVSEDETVNVIPDFIPQINHEEIIDAIKILKSLNSADNFHRKTFNDIMFWLTNRRFYLREDECQIINKLKKDLHELDLKAGGTTMWINHQDLYPNHQMKDSYYL